MAATFSASERKGLEGSHVPVSAMWDIDVMIGVLEGMGAVL